MEALLPGYYRTVMDLQEDFVVKADRTRRIPSVLEHLSNPESLTRMTEEISQLSSQVIEERIRLLELCFEGVVGLKEHLLQIFDRYFGDGSPLSGCSRDVKIAAAAAITQAYPYEGLAAFNPTIAPLSDISGLPEGHQRVVLALRSYGEFHRSAISFRTGVIDAQGNLNLDRPQKTEAGFTVTHLPQVEGTTFTFPAEAELNSFVLYAPFVGDLEETWEDLRLTPFTGEGEYEGAYLGTFTSFNLARRRLQAMALVTRDFRTFFCNPLRGSGVEDKNMAFFPRKINGRFHMLSRNNSRDLFLMTSDDLYTWKKKKKIADCRPDSFDAHKMGVCAPPIETAEGWVVIYHGVSDPGQIYSLGAMLLDGEDPSIVKARLPYSIHCPLPNQELGMLSHIHYTCGAMVHTPSGKLVVPITENDSCWKVGRLGLEELLARLRDDGKV